MELNAIWKRVKGMRERLVRMESNKVNPIYAVNTVDEMLMELQCELEMELHHAGRNKQS